MNHHPLHEAAKTKFCTDCIYCTKDNPNGRWTCAMPPLAPVRSPVTGKVVFNVEHECATQRSAQGQCLPQGHCFTPPPLPARPPEREVAERSSSAPLYLGAALVFGFALGWTAFLMLAWS